MGKKKAVPVWRVFLRGNLLALGVYLAGILVLALLLVRGVVPESSAFPVTAALCLAGAGGGGWLAARQSPWGTLPSALLNTAIFAAVLAAVGLLCWEGVTWNGRGGILLLCALAGGFLDGILGGRRPSRRRKRK